MSKLESISSENAEKMKSAMLISRCNIDSDSLTVFKISAIGSAGGEGVYGFLAVYVLTDYQAARLAKAHPKKIKVNRIGLTVSTKLGGAVVRSRVRRILRA